MAFWNAQDRAKISDDAGIVVCALSAAGVSNSMVDDMEAANRTGSLNEFIKTTLPDRSAIRRVGIYCGLVRAAKLGIVSASGPSEVGSANSIGNINAATSTPPSAPSAREDTTR